MVVVEAGASQAQSYPQLHRVLGQPGIEEALSVRGREHLHGKIKDSSSAGCSVLQPSLLSQLAGAGLSKLLRVSILPLGTHLAGIFFLIYKCCLLPAPDWEWLEELSKQGLVFSAPHSNRGYVREK